MVEMIRPSRAIRISVPPDPQNLALLRGFFEVVAEQCGLTHDEALKVVMAVDEACDNSIKGQRGARSESTQEINVTVEVESNRLTITIMDPNTDFTALFKKPIDMGTHFQEYRTHGLGLQMIRTFMDEVEYVHRPGKGNELKMVKYV